MDANLREVLRDGKQNLTGISGTMKMARQFSQAGELVFSTLAEIEPSVFEFRDALESFRNLGESISDLQAKVVRAVDRIEGELEKQD